MSEDMEKDFKAHLELHAAMLKEAKEQGYEMSPSLKRKPDELSFNAGYKAHAARNDWNYDMDAAPRDGTNILVTDGHGIVFGDYYGPILEEYIELEDGLYKKIESKGIEFFGDIILSSCVAWKYADFPNPPKKET